MTYLTACQHCGEPIQETDDGRWIDAGTRPEASIVYCHDQDETHDGQRHEPQPPPDDRRNPDVDAMNDERAEHAREMDLDR